MQIIMNCVMKSETVSVPCFDPPPELWQFVACSPKLLKLFHLINANTNFEYCKDCNCNKQIAQMCANTYSHCLCETSWQALSASFLVPITNPEVTETLNDIHFLSSSFFSLSLYLSTILMLRVFVLTICNFLFWKQEWISVYSVIKKKAKHPQWWKWNETACGKWSCDCTAMSIISGETDNSVGSRGTLLVPCQ